MSEPHVRGLTAAEVAERVRQGRVNRTPRSEWRDYTNIVSRNVINWFNAMVTPAAIYLFVLGEWQGGIAVCGMAVVNTLIGLVHEIKSKWHLDKLAILVETKARVQRDGEVQAIAASEVVLGDHILLASGEAIVADGPVVESRFLEIDEALLTGESDPVRRQVGEPLLSGSFCVAGEGMYRADRVGAEAFANNTSIEARRYSYTASPMTKIINFLIQILSYTAIGLCVLYAVVYMLGGYERPAELEGLQQQAVFVRMVAATITSMVPQGLVLTATIAFTLGAVVMSSRGAVVQRLNAVEAMAAVDVVCTDKTGTLTTNQLKLDQIRVLTHDLAEEEVRRRLQLFASASVDRQNKNLIALRAALGETPVELLDQLPFKSQNRYSAVRARDGGDERVLVMGACEALKPLLSSPAPRVAGAESSKPRLAAARGVEDSAPATQAASASGGTSGGEGAEAWEHAWKELSATGLRILMFAEAPERSPFAGTLEGFTLRPLALVALSDELRPDAGDVLETLARQGIDFKIVSGDNPETVRATVSHLNLPLARDPVVSGDQLAAAPNKAELVLQRSVFGRVAPLQKVEIVQTLQDHGRFVAMIGDGVNDVLPIKKSHLGIAMGEGSQAAKTVSGLVLENNNFALLPETLEEGRTIVRNLRRSAKLFLTKNVYAFLLILPASVGLFDMPFPLLPQQVTLLNWLVIGMPALVITFSRERSKAATKPQFLREVGSFAIRTGLVFALAGWTILLLSTQVWDPCDPKTQRTLLLSMLILLGITALLRALSDGETQPLVGDTKFRWLAAAAVPAYLLAMYWEPSRDFFHLATLDWQQWLQVLAVALPAFGLCKLSDRWRIAIRRRVANALDGPTAFADGNRGFDRLGS